MKTEIDPKLIRFAKFYDFSEYLPEKLLVAGLRKKIIPRLYGKILEVGVGSGKNLKYYSDKAEVIAIDISSFLLDKAKRELKKVGKKNIKLLFANVEHLPFADKSFDYVLSTFVFCSVKKPIQGFEEVKRVLKDNGQAIFLEHVRSKNIFVAKIQDLFNLLTKALFGEYINRQTWENIAKGGLKIVRDDNLALGGIIRLFTCRK